MNAEQTSRGGEVETDFVVNRSLSSTTVLLRAFRNRGSYPCNEGVMLIADSVESRLLEMSACQRERQAIESAEEREASLRACILQPIVGCGAT